MLQQRAREEAHRESIREKKKRKLTELENVPLVDDCLTLTTKPFTTKMLKEQIAKRYANIPPQDRSPIPKRKQDMIALLQQLIQAQS